MPVRVQGRVISGRGCVLLLLALVVALIVAVVVVALLSAPAKSAPGSANHGAAPPTSTATDTPTFTPSDTPTATVTCLPFQAYEVGIHDYYFDPATYQAPDGGVTWRNDGVVTHTTTSDTGFWDSGPLEPGHVLTRLFLPVGVYSYHCSIHPQMTGVIVVQPVCIAVPTPYPWPTSTPCLVPTPLTTPTPCADITFTDVQPIDYFYEAVRNLYCVRRAISGYADNTFRPGNNITRGQVCKLVVLAMHWPLLCYPYGYRWTDVRPGHPYFYYIETAYEHYIISGYAREDGTFRPYNPMTRGQFAKVVVLAKQWYLYCPPTGHFSDVESSSPFYCYIETAYSRGVLGGYADGTFRPWNDITRGQAAKIMYTAIIQP